MAFPTLKLIVGLCALASSPVLVFAQTAVAPDAGSGNGVLEEVVITAQRRSENQQTIPIAVTALAGDQLESKAVVRLSDLQFASPGLSVSEAGLTQNVNIRGIGLAAGVPSVANGVATYIDGLFQPPIVSANAFYDLANVEVLRGPQGTLVGSNSTGGAIFINSQSPRLGEVSGYSEVGTGNYGSVTAQGAINLPVGETLAVRAAVNYISRNSFYSSLGPIHTDAAKLEEKSGRLSVLWKPGDFEALLKVEYVDRDSGGYAYRPIPGTQYAPYAPAGDFNLSYDSPEENHERGLIVGLELRYLLADGITLRSLTGYQDKNIHNLYDIDATSEVSPANDQAREDQYIRERVGTEEINVISPTDGPYNWILGAYFQRNKIDVNLTTYADDFPTKVAQPQNKTTTGWFGQLNYHLNDQFELQTGLRYSTFKVDGDGSVIIGAGIPGFPPTGLPVANLAGDHRDDRATGKIDLNYQLDGNNLLYAFVARGYKPGGFNSSTSQFDPETVMDYEAGWKSTMLDGHVRTQLGVFYDKYHDFQFAPIDLTSGQVGVVNLPSATIKGVEAQVQAQLGHWQIDSGLAYVDSHLVGNGSSFVNTKILPQPGAGNLGPQCAAGVASNATCFDYGPYSQPFNGGTNLYSPRWSVNAGAEYRIDFSSGVSFTPRLNYAYLSSQYTNLSYSQVTDFLPSHGLLSTLLTLRLPHDWVVEGYGTNLTNKIYLVGQFDNNEFFGAPRQYGVRVSEKF